jgi:hypothetical protein
MNSSYYNAVAVLFVSCSLLSAQTTSSQNTPSQTDNPPKKKASTNDDLGGLKNPVNNSGSGTNQHDATAKDDPDRKNCETVINELEIAEKLMGCIKKGIYTGPNKDFQIQIPELLLGGHVRDEGSRESREATMVIFTDDLGMFYRVVSFPPSDTFTTDDFVAGVFKNANVRDKQVVQTSKGREWRIIDIEKNGAEITKTDGAGHSMRPDLVNASVVFAANNRVYQVTAGVPVGLFSEYDLTGKGSKKTGKPEGRIGDARKKLDEFLAGFKTLKQ